MDLPGVYGLDVSGGDQEAARAALLQARPDVVVAVVDATNLARNLFLVLQLLDLGYRVVVALNLVDEARRRAVDVDARAPRRAARRAGRAHRRPDAARGSTSSWTRSCAWRRRRTAPAAAPSATTARPSRSASTS